MAGLLAVVAGLVLVGVALLGGDEDGAGRGTDAVSGSGDAATTAPTLADGLGEGFAPERRGRAPLRGFGEVTATITSGSGETCQVCLLAATDAAQHQRGLMEVTDRNLGGYDGMVFVYQQDQGGAFWMRNTPMPLSIAYFDRDGELVSTADMAPCRDSPDCPDHPAAGPFRLALEVPKGRLGDLAVEGDATIVLGSAPCPLAT